MPTNDGIYLKGEILMSRPAADAKESGCTGLRIHVYICESWDGEAIEQVLKHNLQRRVPDARTEEMLPAWYNIADQNLTASAGKGDRNIPLDEMVRPPPAAEQTLTQSVAGGFHFLATAPYVCIDRRAKRAIERVLRIPGTAHRFGRGLAMFSSIALNPLQRLCSPSRDSGRMGYTTQARVTR